MRSSFCSQYPCPGTLQKCICYRYQCHTSDQYTKNSHAAKSGHFSNSTFQGISLHDAVNKDIKYSKKSNHVQEIITGDQQHRYRDHEPCTFPALFSIQITLKKIHKNCKQCHTGTKAVMLSPENQITGKGPCERRCHSSDSILHQFSVKQISNKGNRYHLQIGRCKNSPWKKSLRSKQDQKIVGNHICRIIG